MKKYLLILSILLSNNIYAKQLKLLFLGDSLTEGYGVAKKNAYPQVVKSLLEKDGHKIKLINGSVSGSTSASAISRYKWFKKANADYLFIALGANDGLRGIEVDTTFKNLDKLVTMAIQDKVNVILAGMYLPPNYGKKYRTDFAGIFEKLNKKHKLIFIPFLLDGVAGEKELNLADGIHPNEKGHLKMANLVYSKIKESLNVKN